MIVPSNQFIKISEWMGEVKVTAPVITFAALVMARI